MSFRRNSASSSRVVPNMPAVPALTVLPRLQHRQAQMMSRQGIDLDRSTLADWVGRAAFELRSVFDALIANLKRSFSARMSDAPDDRCVFVSQSPAVDVFDLSRKAPSPMNSPNLIRLSACER